MSLSRNRSLRARENAEWSGILSSMLKPQNQRYARLTLTSRQSNRSERRLRRSRGLASGSSELDRPRGGRAPDNAAKARHRPTIDRALLQSRAPGDRPAPPLQGRTNKTAALDPAPTDPSWPIPAADRVNVRESLFAEAFNGLLQQNLPIADVRSPSDRQTYKSVSRASSAVKGEQGRLFALGPNNGRHTLA